MRGLILAAGLGERLRPLTSVRAKPAIEFLNVPMLAFPYHWLNTLGLTELVFNTHYLPETVRHAAMQVVDPSVALHFTHEPAILGSGGGIWNARFFLQAEEDFVVANGDGVILSARPQLLQEMLAFHKSQKALATVLVCPLEGVGTRLPGVWMNAQGVVSHFGKEARGSGLSCLHYASVLLLNRQLWTHLPDGASNILYEVLEPRIQAGDRVYGFRADDLQWFETGNVADYLSATKTCMEILQNPSAPMGWALRAILESHAPSYQNENDLARQRLIADNASVDPSAQLEGFAVIGDEAKVGHDAVLKNCVVLPGAIVDPGVAAESQVFI